jgi:hypothetical protein
MIPQTFWHLGLFFVYLIASWLVLVLLFRLAAYRKYFFHLVPFVIGYAAVAAGLLRYLGFQDLFWWYFVLSSFFFSMALTRYLRSKDVLDAFAQLEKSVLESMPEDEIKQQVREELSPNRQITQHVLVAVVVFIVSLILAFYVANVGL